MYSLQHGNAHSWWHTASLTYRLRPYSSLMPWLRGFATIGALSCILVIIIQFAYPSDRTLPFMYKRLGLGGISSTELTARLKTLNDTRYQVGILGTGAVIDISAAQQQLLDYTWHERLVPFSLLSHAGDDLPVSMGFSLVEPPSVNEPVLAGVNASNNNQTTVYNDEISAVLQGWMNDYPALKASVAFQELNGSGVSSNDTQASVNGDMLMPTASVFKLYLAAYALKQIEAGTLNPATPITGGKDVAKCIEVMIVKSDNACGEALGAKLGWSKLHTYTRSLGMTTSKLNISPLQSTANDSIKFLSQLSAGTLLSPANTDLLLSYMARQTYRVGIPAGAPGATVYDKPGWDSSIANDIAIVRSPDANYILTVYTSSNNSQAIKELSNRISAFMSN